MRVGRKRLSWSNRLRKNEVTMHWGADEIFSVISGLVLLGAAFVPTDKVSNRLWAAGGGIALIIYGIYVANQTSGTFYFPVWIFVIPFGAAIYIVVSMAKRKRDDER